MKINEKIGLGRALASSPQVLRMMSSDPVFRGRCYQALKKCYLVMKLTILIITVCLLQVSAASVAQITIRENRASLVKILDQISSQSGYDMVYSVADLKDIKPMRLVLNDVSLERALQACFEGQPLIYEVADKTVMIRAKEDKGVMARIIDRLNAFEASGRVVDAEGKPLPGATIRVKNGKGSTLADASGRFSLGKVEEGTVLVISYTGYISKEVKAEKDMGNVVLQVSLSKLDEVQVIAYGTTTQRLSTGNVTTIKADVIEKQPVNNPLLALQGRVPGLFIEQATGFAGTGVKVRIQGQNSVYKGNDPLYVIDGVPYISQLLPGGNPILGYSGAFGGEIAGTGNPLSFINPSDIESIDVLKDADATAIYGSRAANGAILITTKKGRVGETEVVINAQSGIGKVANKLEMLNTNQYLQMRHEALKNDGISSPGPYDFDINGTWDSTRNMNWQKEFIGGSAKYNDIQTSISGGSENTQFLLGAGYHRETTVFPDNYADVKGSIHFSVSNTSLNKRLKLYFSGSYQSDKNLLPIMDLTQAALFLAPLAPDPYNPDGSLNWQPDPSGASTYWGNPFTNYKNSHKSLTSELNSNAIVGYEIIPGLNFNSSFGYRSLVTNAITLYPISAVIPEYQQYGSSGSNFLDNRINSWIIEPNLTFNRQYGKSHINVLLGSTLQQNKNYSQQINASGFISELLMEDLKSANNTSIAQSINSVYKYNAIYSRASYNWDNKYLANITFRRDGSSRFGPKSQFHNFGAIGAAWIFTKEKLISENVQVLSFGKLRMSYGTTGNDQIGDYKFMELYDSMAATIPYQNSLGLTTNSLRNPYLQWEETRKFQVGMDFGLFKDRFLININYNRNRSSNQLLSFPLPIITGAYGIERNLQATVQNTGWEISATTENIRNKNFTWTSSFNITAPRNKIIKYDDLPSSSFVLGQPISIIMAYKFAGMNTANGLYQFIDKDGKLTSSPSDPLDKTTLINIDPRFYGGLQNSFNYKSFSLDFLISFVKQQGLNWTYYSGYYPPGLFGQGLSNQTVTVLDRWKKDGDNTISQRFASGYGTIISLLSAKYSNAGYSDASYARLKNVSLSWKSPTLWSKAIHLRALSFYLQGQNLLTFTNYKGLDPESGGTGLPPLRVITLGVKIGL